VATKRAIYEEINRNSELMRGAREAIYTAVEPLLTRAQRAGAARGDVTGDDLLRLISGLTAGGYVDDAQRERVLAIALDGVRAR
jgi:hypothetical protein